MSFRTRRILFSTPLFMLFEFFFFKYLLSLFIEVNEIYLIVLVIILGLIQSVPMFFEEKNSTPIGRCLTTFFGVLEWFLMMGVFYLIIVYGLGLFIKIPRKLLYLGLFVIAVIGIYAYVHAHQIIVKKKLLTFDNLDRDYNIIHISDVHFGSVRNDEIISGICDRIKSVEDDCDLLIISGDLADGSCVVKEDDFMPFSKIDIPVIFTSGNHDYYPGIGNVHRACKKAGMIVLENDSFEYDDLNIYGLSYSFDRISMPGADELRSVIKEDKINILNYHVPAGWNEFSDMGFDIQLSGHTHGGQFYPVNKFGNLLFEGHNMGLFSKVDDNNRNHYLHVTTGVGSMDVPMRWGTDSEIVILNLRKGG